MPLDFNTLLLGEGVDPVTVGIMRHRPFEPSLARAFRWLPAERLDLFEAYQRTHSARIEKSLTGLQYLASFVGLEAGTATFVGLYRNCGHETITLGHYLSDPEIQELKQLGMSGWTADDQREQLLKFDFQRVAFYEAWQGRLKIGWPPPERSWWRRANRNTMPVLSITEESVFSPAIPPWDSMVFTWAELNILPANMRAALAQWRGIYLIRDSADGMSYVGSAGGGENLLGRWRGYAASGHGGNRLLRRRDPAGFVFSILQRTSPDLPQDALVEIENGWKRRLQTRFPQGLNDN